jgi:hypothetical protein
MSVHEIIEEIAQSRQHKDHLINLIISFKQLVQLSHDIPHPGQGRTLERWQTLAQVAALDLNLVKWFESHLDALSILSELGHDTEHLTYAVWAAEGSAKPIVVENGLCHGIKSWCSGAGIVEKALLTYRDENKDAQLILVDLRKANTQIDHSVWKAVGMCNTATAEIYFDGVAVEKIGISNEYLTRAGFWHGAAGVAACWYGASRRLAKSLYEQIKLKPHPYKKMYLGEVSTALHLNRRYFYDVAKSIDQSPKETHEYQIRMLRQFTEQTARMVIDRVGLALGAAPFCQDEKFSQLAADLGVFIRQTHGAFDLEHIGNLAIEQEAEQWVL